MNKKIIFSLLIILLVFQALAGKKVGRTSFGNVSVEELQIKSNEIFPDAGAVVLHDYGSSEMEYTASGFRIKFNRRYRLKIFDESAFNKGDFKLYLYRGKKRDEKLIELRAASYNMENGKVVASEVKKDGIFVTYPSDYRVKHSLSIPNVREGSVVEVTYTYASPFLMNMPTWYFQSDIPVLYSDYRIKICPIFKYQLITTGYEGVAEASSHEDAELTPVGRYSFYFSNYHYIKRNTPAFNDESYISSVNDYISKLEAQLSQVNYPGQPLEQVMSTWPKLSTDLMESQSFGRTVNSRNKLLELELAKTKSEGLESLEKTKAIVNHFKDTYKWNRGYGFMIDQSIKDITTTHEGSVSDLNLLLVGVLKKAGLDANPVILSTRGHGKVYMAYPFHHYFNYVIASVKIGNKVYLMDATASDLAFNKLPTRCFNGYGLIVKENSDSWLLINDMSISKSNTTMELNVNLDSNRMDVKTKYLLTSHDAYGASNHYDADTYKLIAQIKSDGMEQVEELEMKLANRDQDQFRVSFSASANYEKIDDEIYIKPFLDDPITENPFKTESRKYPVDLIFRKGRNYMSKINIPVGYEIGYTPNDTSVKKVGVGSFSYRVMANEESVVVMSNYTLDKPIIEAKHYNDLKELYSLMIESLHDRIMIRPKEQ